MRKEVLIARIGRILILLAIFLSIMNIFYWKNTIIDAVAIILAAVSLIIVILISRTLFSNMSPELAVFNEAMGRVQLLNIVYKGVIEYDFESLPLSVEEEVKNKIPSISTEDLLKTYNFILKIPKDLKVYIYKDILPKNRDLFKSRKTLIEKIENKYPWMDNESLNLTVDYFFKNEGKGIN